MAEHNADIVIFGAGIAGLWTFNRLKSMGYDVLLLEQNTIGGGQTIASQGIIHSGLKYALAGKVNELAQSISAMPDVWRAALRGEGPVDLSTAGDVVSSQHLLIPSGFMGGIVKLATTKALGENIKEVDQQDWPEDIKKSGFQGHVIYMNEPILDITKIVRTLAEPYRNNIRKIESVDDALSRIKAKTYIYTAASGNLEIARQLGHDTDLETQARPLLMGLMKPAPFELHAHLVGSSDKPVATITTHKTKDGELVWYIGGAVAERAKEASPEDVFKATKKAFAKYLPAVDVSAVQWATLPIDRIEGKSSSQGWLPDTPTVHAADNSLYCWPTKLTFAPLLADMVVKHLEEKQIEPSNTKSDWSFLPEANYAQTPWDTAIWTKEN